MAFVCLMYHSLSDGRFPDKSYLKYTTTGSVFATHLDVLKGAGFHFLNFTQLLGLVESNSNLPGKICVLSFDDGHKSSLEMAQIMAKVGATGTFFLTKSYCSDRPDFLKPDEIRDMAKSGLDFGTHGVTHRSLAHLPREEMKAELADSKSWLENILRRPVTSMSLPAGQGDSVVYQTAFELGYRLVGNSREALNVDLKAPTAINRFVILASHNAATVQDIATGCPTYILKRRLRSALLYLPKRILKPYNETRQNQ